MPKYLNYKDGIAAVPPECQDYLDFLNLLEKALGSDYQISLLRCQGIYIQYLEGWTVQEIVNFQLN